MNSSRNKGVSVKITLFKKKNIGVPGWLAQLSMPLDLSSGLLRIVVSSSPLLGSMLGIQPT